MRELNAVLLIPTFLPTMRMNVSSNWFKLTDPEHLVFHTGRMMEQGRRVQELRQARGRRLQRPAVPRRRPARAPVQARAARGDASHAVARSSSSLSRTAPAASTCSPRERRPWCPS